MKPQIIIFGKYPNWQYVRQVNGKIYGPACPYFGKPIATEELIAQYKRLYPNYEVVYTEDCPIIAEEPVWLKTSRAGYTLTETAVSYSEQ